MLFLAPMMAVLMVVAVFPVLYSFWISLFDLKLTRPHRVPFVWFDNYLQDVPGPAVLGIGRAARRLHRDVGGGDHGASPR